MIDEKVIKVVQQVSGTQEDLDRDVNLNVYGLDSLSRVQLVVALEDEFNISFADKDLTQDNFSTTNSVIELMKEYGVK